MKDNAATPNVQSVGKIATITYIPPANAPTAVATALPAQVASGATLAGQTVTFASSAGGTPKTLSITANNGVTINGGPFTVYGVNTYDIVAPINNTGVPITVTVTYSALDHAGNISAVTTRTFDIAPAVVNAAPTLTVVALPAQIASSGSISGKTFTTADDKVWGVSSAISVTMDNGATITGGPFIAYGVSTYGINAPANTTPYPINARLTVSVTDSDGAITTNSVRTININPALPTTPTGPSINGAILSWTGVSGAASYTISSNLN